MMIRSGDYIEEKGFLVIGEMTWKDIKQKLDDDEMHCYSHIYDEEKERFEARSRTHKLWQVLSSDGRLGIMWEKLND